MIYVALLAILLAVAVATTTTRSVAWRPALASAGGPINGTAARGLARTEGIRMLRHPLVLLALVAVLTNFPYGGISGPAGWEFRWGISGAHLNMFAMAAMVVVHLAVSRDHRSGTDELAASLPTGKRTRTAAHALSLAWVLVPMTLLWAVYVPIRMGADLTETIVEGGEHGAAAVVSYVWQPSILELAQGPLAVTVYVLLALATGVWWRHAVGGAVVALLFVWSPLVWIIPLVVDLGTVLPWEATETVTLPFSITIWHYVFLTGAAALMLGAALVRHGSRRLWAAVMLLGATAVAFGGAFHLTGV